MARENVDIVRAAYSAISEEGVEALLRYIHPGFEGTTPPHLGAEPDTYR